MIKLTLCFLAVLSPQVFAFPKEMTVKVALSITVDGEPAGDIKIGLFGNTVPKTVDNFVQICEGAEDLVDTRGQHMTYKGTKFSRLLNGIGIMGGDVSNTNQIAGESIYRGYFDDENYEISNFAGAVTTLGSDTGGLNGSSFFITTKKMTKYGSVVVYGKVFRNMRLVKQLSKMGHKDGKPKKEIVISDCRVIDDEKYF